MILGTGPGNAFCSGQTFGGQSPPGPVTPTSDTPIATERSDPFSVANPHGHGLASIASPRNQTAVSAASSSQLYNPTYPALRTNGIHDVDFIISGTGNRTDERCGDWSRSYACSKEPGHFLKTIKHSCDNPTCPICFGSWMNKAAKRISERVRGYIAAANDAQTDLDGAALAAWHKDNTRYLNHYILSPRPGEILPDMPYNAIKQRGRAMAARIGITGAVQLFHPYRIRKALHPALVRVCRGAVHMNEEDREKKFWELVREDALHLGGWREYVEWGPHFHYIGFGRLPDRKTPEEKAAAAETLAGWIVKWVRHVETERHFTGQEIEDPIAALAAYLLSHAGYQEGRKIPSWLGVLGPNELKKKGDPEQLSHAVVCPVCGAPVVMGEESYGAWMNSRDPNGDPIPYRLRYCIQVYEIKKRPGLSGHPKKE